MDFIKLASIPIMEYSPGLPRDIIFVKLLWKPT